MARGKFGERLKRERELREVSMDELTKATRISARFINALENEDWDQLPGGIFGHGFVRSIARYLGLDEEALLGEYDLARAEKLPPAPPKPEERIPSPPKWVPAAAVLIIFLFAVIVFFVVRYGWRRLSAHSTARQSTALLELNGKALPPPGVPGTSGTIEGMTAQRSTEGMTAQRSMEFGEKNLGQASGGTSKR